MDKGLVDSSSVDVLEFSVIQDHRGALVALEAFKQVPFDIKRIYYIFGVVPGQQRGGHAHRSLQQLAVMLRGSCVFVMDDGRKSRSVRVTGPAQGIFIDRLVWHHMRDFSPDAFLLVLASDGYDESDYFRNYDEFIRAVR